MRKLLIIVLIVIAVPTLWLRWSFPAVTYRYRLTIAVESDGQAHSQSTVIEVWHRFNPRLVQAFIGTAAEGGVRGQGVFIDLGARGALVSGIETLGYDTCSVGAIDLVGRAYEPAAMRRPCVSGYPLSLQQEQALAEKRGRIALTTDEMPPFFWFSDPAKLATARPVTADKFADVIGDSVRLVSAQVEVTQDPVDLDSNKRVPACAAPDKAPSNLTIKCRMFVARGAD